METSISEILKLATQKDIPWIKKRREIVKDKRILYTVRSDFLAKYTDIWHRNRYPDTERVHEIMKSIKKEKEIDNRIYLAWIQNSYDTTKLYCFDGNHRREALVRLYRTDGFTCWVDLDVLIDVPETSVIDAFRRINQGVSVPEVYVEQTEETSLVEPIESYIQSFQTKWKQILVDKSSTRSPYCTKNTLIEIITPYIHKQKELNDFFTNIHNDNKTKKYPIRTEKICFDKDCYIFAQGIEYLRKVINEKM